MFMLTHQPSFQGNIYDTPDRKGIALDLLILFRDIHPKVRQLAQFNLFKKPISGRSVHQVNRAGAQEQYSV